VETTSFSLFYSSKITLTSYTNMTVLSYYFTFRLVALLNDQSKLTGMAAFVPCFSGAIKLYI
jgi:hypothetical protein